MKKARFHLPSILYRLGFFRIIRYLLRNRITILFAHGLYSESLQYQWRPLRPLLHGSVLRKQLEVISKYYNWVTLDDAVGILNGSVAMTPNSIVLTFDDGYRNSATVGLPITQEYSIVPTFFIATGFCNSAMPYWVDRLDFALQLPSEPYEILTDDVLFSFDPTDRRELSQEFARLRYHLKSRDWTQRSFSNEIDRICNQLERRAGQSLGSIQTSDACSSTLSDSEISEFHTNHLVTFGSHTVNHALLDNLSAAECREELVSSKLAIESITQQSCRHFCYPNGIHNVEIRELALEAGYESACTTEPGVNKRGCDMYALHRIHLPAYADETRLLIHLSGIPSALEKIKRKIRRIFSA
ncbi:MAG: polysaccharide deacetylase family protein [Chloroflexi bacterium]|nr:polysaccharide deacetylase family protein [Chloroflexota bacterium]